MTPELLRFISQIKAQGNLIAYEGAEIHRIPQIDLFYIESVDNRTFLYLDKTVYESKQRLYELEEILSDGDFLRISKSIVVNMSKIKSITPMGNGRFEARLENDEKLIISRQYISDLKDRLGI